MCQEWIGQECEVQRFGHGMDGRTFADAGHADQDHKGILGKRAPTVRQLAAVANAGHECLK